MAHSVASPKNTTDRRSTASTVFTVAATGLYTAVTCIAPGFTAGYAILCAMLVWGYLYNPRAVGMFHAQPEEHHGQEEHGQHGIYCGRQVKKSPADRQQADQKSRHRIGNHYHGQRSMLWRVW